MTDVLEQGLEQAVSEASAVYESQEEDYDRQFVEEDLATDAPAPEVEDSADGAEDVDTGDKIRPTDYNARGSVLRSRSDISFLDHFTLRVPSSTVRFRERDVTVFGERSSQIQVEDNGAGQLLVRRVKDSSFGLSALRFWYCLIVFLMGGLVLIFTLQLFLLLFLGLSVNSGLTSKADFNFAKFFGTLLSIPIWIYSLASAMAIATAFLTDTWAGSKLFKSIAPLRSVWVEWAAFAVYLGLPLIIAIGCLFSGTDDWWRITSISWFAFVFTKYTVYTIVVIIFETRGCFELMRHNKVYKEKKDTHFLTLLRSTIVAHQVQKYSGTKQSQYTVSGSQINNNGAEARESIGLYSRLTISDALVQWGIFSKLKEPRRRFCMDEVRDSAPFVTANTWGLEKLFCRNRKDRYVAVVSGPAAMTRNQVKSSFVCACTGIIFFILTVAAILSWVDASGAVLGIALALLVLCTLPSMVKIYKSYRLYKDVEEQAREENEKKGESQAMYQVWETRRISRPSDHLCWTMFALEIIFFFLLPLIALFRVGNIPIALLFLLAGAISLVRYYCNPAHIIKELGQLDKFLDEDNDSGPYSDWRDQHRMNLILGKITQGRTRDLWIKFFGLIVLIFVMIFSGAYYMGADDGKEDIFDPLSDFEYPAQGGVPYPACTMARGMAIPGFETTALADYTFLSVNAYSSPGETQINLDDWFGKDENGQSIAEDRQDIVNEFREGLSETQRNSAVTYKLIDFPSKDFQVVAIRGTSNGWDALTDAQLWSAAWIAQQVRWVIPYGIIFNSVFESVIDAISFIQTETLKQIAFYQQTTEFVKWLNSTKNYENIYVTGHSLGGGLAMITGVQSLRPAVALSGPNAMLSRNTFDPPLEADLINKLTFNIVPARDPVPRIDDLAQNFQRISCTAPANNPIACHFGIRSLCEVLYTCGSMGRPTFCFCHNELNYPPPTPTGNRNYASACSKAP